MVIPLPFGKEGLVGPGRNTCYKTLDECFDNYLGKKDMDEESQVECSYCEAKT